MAWALFLIASETRYVQRIEDARHENQEIHIDVGLLGAYKKLKVQKIYKTLD